ncbi:tRNA-splicing endonuclease subunit sen54, partial [Podila epigama]
AVTHFKDPKVLADVSEDLGEAMVGINISELPEEQRYSSRGCSSVQTLPSREAKTTGTIAQGSDTTNVLDDQYDAYFQILNEERRAAERTYSRAVYEPEKRLFRLTLNRGNHFVSMGHTINGNIYLYPEEALFLVDRGSLLAEHMGVDMTVQQVWCVYLQQAMEDRRQLWHDNSLQQSAKTGPSKAMDMCIVYAYLKRLGFVITRPGLWFSSKSQWLWREQDTPLVSNKDELTHEKIRIIPSTRLSLPMKNLCDRPTKPDMNERAIIDFEVYKPAGAFKKRQPGTPDYRIVVVEAGAPLPTLQELSEYLHGQIDPAAHDILDPLVSTTTTPASLEQQQHSTPATAKPLAGGSGKGKKTKAPDWPKILFAVVDSGQSK